MMSRIKSKGDPAILKKNRDAIVDEMRDDYGYLFCLKCSKSSGFRNLHVHHLVFRSEAPYHPNVHDKKNLYICCDKCHDEFHKNKYVREPILASRS